MHTLYNKRILLGLCGSVAAYKAAELTRRLREHGAEVRVVMTRSATEFITALTLQALSGQPVHSELMDADSEAAMGHIELARWADLILIAPASADFVARLAQGRANDLLSAICLASDRPIAIAPAMNQGMWQNPATQDNIQTLRTRKLQILGPADGSQACGEIGPGRMLEPQQILEHLEEFFLNGELAGKHVLVTAGPTREPIDPVRYISNRSSGKMGYAIATAAREAGARVTLVSGPVTVAAPDGVDCIRVESANDMHQAVLDRIQDVDIFIATAAVADYRPGLQAVSKIKKQQAEMTLKLTRTADILSAVAALPEPPFTVGFAAETDNVLEYARNKLQRKNLDMIVANAVGDNKGFDQDDNELDVLWHDGHVHLAPDNKFRLARELIQIINRKINAKHSTQNTG